MYTSFFGLNEPPFSITPDPRYLFMSERHGEALAHLVYGVTDSGGFVQLTGEVGTGKTTLVRTLLQNRLPDNADVAVVLNPQLSDLEFLETICEELGIADAEARGSSKALIDALNHHLLMAHADGRRVILVVDEAQNLSRDVLEQVRLLTNLETARQKLLQIILIGQPELRELLSRTDLRQLAQRITGRYHLEPLSRDETAEYIEHRLRVAGAVGEVFDSGAKREVFRLSHGVPRLINVICDRALLGAYSREARRVSRSLVRRAAAEISGKAYQPVWLRYAPHALVTAGVLVIAAGLWSVFDAREAPLPLAGPAAAEPSSLPLQDETPTAADPAAESMPPPAERVTEAEAQPGLDESLRLAGDLTAFGPAFNALLGQWGLEAAGDAQKGCDELLQSGYECLGRRGSWANLRQFDRPAMLTLTDSDGNSHRVVLTAVRGNLAELSIGGVAVSYPVAELLDLWFGQYLLLWKPPLGQSVPLGPGARNPTVVWLRESLAAIDDRYRAEPMNSDVYDNELAGRVREFQRDHRLDVDGLAGQQTQIIVNSMIAGDDVPRLTMPQLAQD